MSWRGVVTACVLAASSTVAARAAADQRTPVAFDYERRAGCPEPTAFVQAVLARAPLARAAGAGEAARVLVARIKPTAGGLEGQLVVRETDGATTERTVRGQRCDDVVAALAVIAAVIIDPVTAGASSDETTPASPAEAPSAMRPPEAAPVSPVSAVPRAEPPANVPPAAVAHAWRLSAGAGAGLVGGAAPAVLLSLPIFVEASRELSHGLEPAARARFERTAIGSARSPSGGAMFVLTSGAGDFCPVALHAGAMRVQPCARGELGVLSARGRAVEPARSDSRLWVAAGAVARARLAIAGPMFAELEAGLSAPIVRDRFYVEPVTVLYRPPAAAATGAFAVGLAFW